VTHGKSPKKAKKKPASASRKSRPNAGKTKISSRSGRKAKVRSRPGAGSHTAGALGNAPEKPPLIRLLEALEEEEIGFTLIGMTAAVAQGVMASTLDVDLWIDLPSRQYIRVLNIAQSQGATIAANTVVYLEDGTPVNFVYEVTGLGSFRQEQKHVVRSNLYGFRLPVLKLERIRKSKEAIGRDKDKLHIGLIREYLRCRKAAQGKRPKKG